MKLVPGVLFVTATLISSFAGIGVATAERLTLATWNMSWLTGENGMGNHPREDKDFETLEKYAKRLNADVVALQEIGNHKGLNRVFGQDYTFHLSKKPKSQRTGFAVRNGINFKALNDYNELVTSEGLRPGAQIELSFSGQKLRLMSVHLKSGCFSEEEDRNNKNKQKLKACKKLFRQVPNLENWVNRAAIETKLFVILGDFNRRMTDDDGDWILTELNRESGEPQNAAVRSAMEGRKPNCWPVFNDYIDHILMSDGVSALMVPESFAEISYENEDKRIENSGHYKVRYPSDHCPIRIEIEY